MLMDGVQCHQQTPQVLLQILYHYKCHNQQEGVIQVHQEYKLTGSLKPYLLKMVVLLLSRTISNGTKELISGLT